MNPAAVDTSLVTYGLRFLALGLDGIVFPRLLLAASINFPVPHKLVGVHFQTSFFLDSPTIPIGFSLVIGQPLEVLSLSDGVRTVCSQYQGSDFTSGISLNYPTTWGEYGEYDVIVNANESLCLYGTIGPVAEPPAIIVCATCHLKPLI